MWRFLKLASSCCLLVILVGYLIPSNISSPILQANIAKIDPESFWCYPWGEAGVHKGIDIFCEKATPVFSPVAGIIYKQGYGGISGNYMYILGPKWRTYYFAHLDTILVSSHRYVAKGTLLGLAGNTGNAAGKPCHLHYAIETVFPYAWLYDKNAVEGWKKMFFLDPNKHLHLHP